MKISRASESSERRFPTPPSFVLFYGFLKVSSLLQAALLHLQQLFSLDNYLSLCNTKYRSTATNKHKYSNHDERQGLVPFSLEDIN